MGLFLSINGWLCHVVGLLKQNPDKAIILMDGFDLRCTLANQIEMRDLLRSDMYEGDRQTLTSAPFRPLHQLTGTA